MPSQITFIIGCSTGIGLAIATTFARDPQRRFLVYASILRPLEEEAEFRDALATVKSEGESETDPYLIPVRVDVTKEDTIKDAVAMITAKHGRIDVFIYNPGLNVFNVTEAISNDTIKTVFDVNFFGLVKATRHVLPGMKRRHGGRIIVMSSIQGAVAFPYNGIYCASKFAIQAFCQEMAVVGRFHNICVSIVEPGPVVTGISQTMVDEGRGGSGMVKRNPDVLDLDKAMSTCFDDQIDYHGLPFQMPSEIADLLLRIATEDKPHFRYQTNPATLDLVKRFYVDPTGDAVVNHQVECLKPYANVAILKKDK